MNDSTPHKNSNTIFGLAFAIAVLILINGAFAYWQMQQVKREFEDVAHRDLPLVSQLLPLIDRQFEQTLMMEKLDKLGLEHQTEVLNILAKSFSRAGKKVDTTLSELNRFIDIQTPQALGDTAEEMTRISAMLKRIETQHTQYQRHILMMVARIKDNGAPLDAQVIAEVSAQEKLLTAELIGLRDDMQSFTQASVDAVEAHETLVIRETTAFTLFFFGLGAVMLFLMRQVMVARDNAVDEITYFATFDSLTKLHNRRFFFERFDQAIKAATRHNHPLSLCVCDLDHFKHVNDTLGHQAGDEVLSSFAGILKKQLRADDVAGRFGGDEFILFFPNTKSQDAVKLLERIRRSLANSHFADGEGNDFTITATFGVAELSHGLRTSSALLGEADRALYKAKEAGRNKVVALKSE